MTKKIKAQGFTLIEMVIAMVLFTFVAFSIVSFTTPVMNLWSYQIFNSGPGTEARLATFRMVRELNQIKDDSSISTADATAISFTTTDNDTISYVKNSIIRVKNGLK